MNSHICHVINTLGTGGAEQYVVLLSNHLDSNGVRVSIVAGEPQVLRDRLNTNIHVELLKLHPGVTRSLVIYMRLLWHTIQHLIGYFRRERVTVVHTHLAASALPAWIAAKFCGIPIIHSKMHTEAIASRFERSLFISRLPLFFVSQFLAFTRYSADEICEFWHAPVARISVSSIGVNTSRFNPKPIASSESRSEFGLSTNDRVMLVVSRLYPEKEVALAIQSTKLLDDPSAVLLIAGDGPQRTYLEKLAKDLKGSSRIIFLGMLQDLRSVYLNADLLLQTTRGPDLGTVVLEAMSSGTPVLIAYRNDNERKMAVNTLGGLEIGAIAYATPQAMANKLKDILADRDHLHALRAQVRTFVEQHHSHDLVFPAMIEIYKNLDRKTRGK